MPSFRPRVDRGRDDVRRDLFHIRRHYSWQPTRSLNAHVPDGVIAEIRSRERNGLVELPKPRGLRPGTRVRVVSGPLSERIGMLALLRPHERVVVLLNLLGGDQRVELAQSAIEAV